MFRPDETGRVTGNSDASPLALIASDYRRHREVQGVLRALVAEGLLASSVYRLRHWAHYGETVPFRTLWKVIFYIAHRLQKVVTGIGISPSTQIGPGLYIMHFGGTRCRQPRASDRQDQLGPLHRKHLSDPQPTPSEKTEGRSHDRPSANSVA